MDERIRINRDTIMPLAKQQKGFHGALLLVDRDTGKSVVITLWDAEANMLAAAPSSNIPESTRQEVTTLLVPGAPYITEHYEVAVQALIEGTSRASGKNLPESRD
jgi:hypothetical protein